jgi:hypothetical protein
MMNKQQIDNEVSQQEVGKQPDQQLTDEQLDTVVGGTKNTAGVKLFESTVKGTHIPVVKLNV